MKEQERGSAKKASAKERKTRKPRTKQACIYCRRSHMMCEVERPCKRCVQRNIGHLCHNESKGENPSLMGIGRVKHPKPTVVKPEFLDMSELYGLGGVFMNGGWGVGSHLGMSPFSGIFEKAPENGITAESMNMSGRYLMDYTLSIVNDSQATFTKMQQHICRYIGYEYQEEAQGLLHSIHGKIMSQIGADVDPGELVIIYDYAMNYLLEIQIKCMSSISIPCCIWKWSGEIIKVNQSFQNLVRTYIENNDKQKVRSIYEFMSPETMMNYLTSYNRYLMDGDKKSLITCGYLINKTGYKEYNDKSSYQECGIIYTFKRAITKVPLFVIGQFISVTNVYI